MLKKENLHKGADEEVKRGEEDSFVGHCCPPRRTQDCCEIGRWSLCLDVS